MCRSVGSRRAKVADQIWWEKRKRDTDLEHLHAHEGIEVAGPFNWHIPIVHQVNPDLVLESSFPDPLLRQSFLFDRQSQGIYLRTERTGSLKCTLAYILSASKDVGPTSIAIAPHPEPNSRTLIPGLTRAAVRT